MGSKRNGRKVRAIMRKKIKSHGLEIIKLDPHWYVDGRTLRSCPNVFIEPTNSRDFSKLRISHCNVQLW